ncbi:MAG: AMP-binding protein [Porticoccaceae bacterium]|jgi:long-chain acyl-CoA synthetase|nr:AMP-binding protein [Porticoccaceae bacterium]MBT4212034.1 AMP-binding protein [Porticoccaceae bacterium]MBT4590810.1 AMP-binding protein [Porticoccaceae bacterium]MBT6028186.1 AMP-binding protein [Porticoccaceae bacterium]MBT6693500.1 AMP-binding protein [Porticoccaceae bacterium]
MLIKAAVIQAQEKVGISTTQPALPARSMLQVWTEAVSDSSSNPAFTCLGQTLSYGEIDQLSRRVASYLQKRLRLQAGDRIAIQLPNLIQYPVVAIAAMKLGLVIVNTNPMYSVRELVHQFNDAGVKAVIVLDQFYSVLAEAAPQTSVEHIIVTRPLDIMASSKQKVLGGLMRIMGKRPMIKDQNIIDFKDLLAGGTSYSNHRASVYDICALQYTGGTTGASKGVMLTQSCLMANVAQALDVISITSESLRYSVTALPLPLYHIYAFSLCIGVLPALRSHSVLIPDPRNIPLLVKVIKKLKIQNFCGLNSLFVALLENEDFRRLSFEDLKMTLSGGMPLMNAVAEKWEKVTGCIISEGYGMTESSPVISMNPPGFERMGTAGIPIPGTEIKVIDEAGNEQPVNGVGELCIRGDQVMAGYWNQPEQTAETVVDGWLHTGDIVTVDDGGYIKIVDRLKDMIIVSGFNVYPNELEQVLTTHEHVSQCAAVGVPDDKAGELVKMFVVRSSSSLTESKVIEFCKSRMAGYKVPKFVEFRDGLPMTNVGKVLRKDLKGL